MAWGRPAVQDGGLGHAVEEPAGRPLTLGIIRRRSPPPRCKARVVARSGRAARCPPVLDSRDVCEEEEARPGDGAGDVPGDGVRVDVEGPLGAQRDGGDPPGT